MSLEMTIKELEGKLAERREQMARLFEEAGPEFDTEKIKSISGDAAAKIDHIRALNAEMDDLRRQIDQKREVLRIAEASMRERTMEAKTGSRELDLGQLFVESVAYKSKGATAHLSDVDVKTLFQRSAGWAPESTRSGLVVDYATRPIQLSDLVPMVPTNQAAYKYMEETTFTNNAAETAEGGGASGWGEAALALTERSATVERICVYLPVTDEQLEDEPGVRAYIDNRLSVMLRQRFDSQILNGDGSTPNLQGILGKSGIQTQAKGTDSVLDAIYKAIVNVRVTGRALPDAVVIHPTDFQGIRLLKTGDGVYIYGSPAEAGPSTLWGLRVVESDAFTAAGTALVGDFAGFSMCALRRGIDIQVTNAHSDYFIKGKQAIRADFRCALVWLRPAAFCKVTGLS